jgi:hemolysin D
VGLSRQLNQSQIKLVSTQDTLKMNQGILDNITPLMNDGAISKIQYFKQQEEVRNPGFLTNNKKSIYMT